MENKTLNVDISQQFIEDNIDKYEICEIGIKILFDSQAQVVYDYDSRKVKLFISHKYDWNKERMNSFLEFLLSHVRGTLTLGQELSDNPVVIKSIADNEKIKNVVISGYTSDSLSKEFYDGLKDCNHIKHIESRNVDISLISLDDPRIVYNERRKDFFDIYSKTRFYCLDDVIGKERDSGECTIDIYDEDVDSLSNNGYKDILNFNPKTKFNVTACLPSNVCKFSKALLDNNLKNKVIINVDTLSEKELLYFTAQAYYKDYSNIYIHYLKSDFKVKRFIKEENLLYRSIREAMELSPFEKYVFAYCFTTTLKDCKSFPKTDTSLGYWGRISRHPYFILHNKYAVCMGYGLLFQDLLYKLGMKSSWITLYSYQTLGDINRKNSVHLRNFNYIKDSKYGIDGFYFSDATWDAGKDNFDMAYLAMTAEEHDNVHGHNGFRSDNVSYYYEEFLYSSLGINEFYAKVNYLINLIQKKNCSNNYLLWERAILLSKIIGLVKPFDNELYTKLSNEFNNINCYDSFDFNNFFNKAVEEVGEFITSKNNKPISGETIMKALKNICLKLRPDEYDEEVLDDIRKENIEWYSLNFPERVKEYSDGHKEYINSKNKFRA